MNIFESIRLFAAFVYALIPYSALYLFTVSKKERISGEYLLKSLIWGIAGFVLTAIPVAAFSFSYYQILHALICLPALAWLALRKQHASSTRSFFRIAPFLVVLLAFLVRLAPYLPHTDWYGGGDMRFHNILAKSIMINDSLPLTWEPFAGIPVNYPLGGHLLAAFISRHAMLPVHTVLNVLLCLYGALSAGMIYLLSLSLFKSRPAALISSIAYGFTALAGSLDYVRWGGMPNSMAMLLLLLMVRELIQGQRTDAAGHSGYLAPALISAAIILSHHYSALAMFLLSAALLFFTPLRKLSLRSLACSISGLLLALLVLHAAGHIPGDTNIGQTSAFRFYEHPISLAEAAMSLNLPFVFLGIFGLWVIIRHRIPPPLSLITAWVTAYFSAFVFLEYGYRLAVFSLTEGQHFFTALTPSRLIADLAYPLSLSAGALVMHIKLKHYTAHAVAVLCAVGLASCFLFFLSVHGATGIPGSSEAITWISKNVPPDSIIVGSLPHLEYRSWRRTSAPPIPASEARTHPDMLEMRALNSVQKWQMYAAARHLRCYFILAGDPSQIPQDMRIMHSYKSISVCVAETAQ